MFVRVCLCIPRCRAGWDPCSRSSPGGSGPASCTRHQACSATGGSRRRSPRRWWSRAACCAASRSVVFGVWRCCVVLWVVFRRVRQTYEGVRRVEAARLLLPATSARTGTRTVLERGSAGSRVPVLLHPDGLHHGGHGLVGGGCWGLSGRGGGCLLSGGLLTGERTGPRKAVCVRVWWGGGLVVRRSHSSSYFLAFFYLHVDVHRPKYI